MRESSMERELADLHPIKLQSIRAVIDPSRYQRSVVRALGWYAFDLALYLGFIVGAFAAQAIWAKLLFGFLAGCAVAFMFVWAHDAAHGALFSNKRVAEVLGTIFMLPSLNMYRLWAFGHNRVHHGFTSFSPIDWIWRPWTPEEYAAKKWWQRAVYRLERSPYTCALHYLLRVWWPGMIRFKADANVKDRHLFTVNKLITFVFVLAYAALAYTFGGGIWGIIAAVVVPFIIFNYFIALFVFLHHTHPDVPFFADRERWSQSIGQLYCSIIVRCSKVSEMLIHNILIHAPHHVDGRIPFYHLKDAYQDLRSQYDQYLHEYRFSFRTVRRIFKQCQLYDYEACQWHSFRSAKEWLAERAEALRAEAEALRRAPGMALKEAAE